MQVDIFVNGCTGCGMNAALIAKVKAHFYEVNVVNTKYGTDNDRARHMGYILQAGMDTHSYHSIVVENNGERISLLKEWKP